jgi:hypothetical protein
VNYIKKYIYEQVAAHKLSKNEAKKMLLEISSSQGREQDDIAIVGMSGRFPKSKDLEEYWQNLIDRVNCIDVPTQKRRGIWEEICKKHFELSEMEADHITPWVQGGKTDAKNCQMLCRDCNRHKSDT